MGRSVGIGHEDFAVVRETNNFYVDKTNFIREWWEDKSPAGDYRYRKLQGTYPVLFLSFAGIKENTFAEARKSMFEYDTPMQEAWVNGYWDELVSFTRSLFNSTFKTNPYLERAIMTGITGFSNTSCEVSESIFSDLNNLEVITTTSDKYADSFGFTEEEVFGALDEFGLSEQRQKVKDWYDGFTFGARKDIYNPWSVINFWGSEKDRFDYTWIITCPNPAKQ